jgi:hypothetical protein
MAKSYKSLYVENSNLDFSGLELDYFENCTLVKTVDVIKRSYNINRGKFIKDIETDDFPVYASSILEGKALIDFQNICKQFNLNPLEVVSTIRTQVVGSRRFVISYSMPGKGGTVYVKKDAFFFPFKDPKQLNLGHAILIMKYISESNTKKGFDIPSYGKVIKSELDGLDFTKVNLGSTSSQSNVDIVPTQKQIDLIKKLYRNDSEVLQNLESGRVSKWDASKLISNKIGGK